MTAPRPQHAIYVPVSDRKRVGYAAVLVAVAAFLVIACWPHASHAAVVRPAPQPSHSQQQMTAAVTVTGTATATICIFPAASASALPKATSKQRPRSLVPGWRNPAQDELPASTLPGAGSFVGCGSAWPVPTLARQ